MSKIKVIALLALMAAFALPAAAQQSIDKIIQRFEDGKHKVEYVAYTERRNPKTKKVYKSSKVIIIDDAKVIAELVKAFKKENERAVNYEVARDKVFKIEFVNGSDVRCYTLVKQRPGKAVLTVETVNDKNRPQGAETDIECDEMIPSMMLQNGLVDIIDRAGFDGLRALEALRGLDGLTFN